jgi:hypothetical protein
MSWARDQVVGGGTTKLVLLLLADYADDDGCCWPGIETVAEKAEINEKSVRRHLQKLEKRGMLERTRRRRSDGTMGTYRYRLIIGPRDQNQPPGRESGGGPEQPENSPGPDETATPVSPPETPTSDQNAPAGRLSGGENHPGASDHRTMRPTPPDNEARTTGLSVRAEPSVEQPGGPPPPPAEGGEAGARSLEAFLGDDFRPALEILRDLRGWSRTVEDTFLRRFVTGPTGELLMKGVPREYQPAVIAECVYQYIESDGGKRWSGSRFMGWLGSSGKAARRNVSLAVAAKPDGEPLQDGSQPLVGGGVRLPDGRRLTEAQAKALERMRTNLSRGGAA